MMLNEFFSSLARARKRQIGALGSREEGQASESHLPETLWAFGMSRGACAWDRIPQRGEEQWGVPGEEETLGPLSFSLDLDPWVGVHRAPSFTPGRSCPVPGTAHALLSGAARQRRDLGSRLRPESRFGIKFAGPHQDFFSYRCHMPRFIHKHDLPDCCSLGLEQF